MKNFLNFLAFVGGVSDKATFDSCSAHTKSRYYRLGGAVLMATILGLISGYDVASQYTDKFLICSLAGLFWGGCILGFDTNIAHSEKLKGYRMWSRMIVGFANIIISISALMVGLNQDTIDTKIRLENQAIVTQLDSSYLSEKSVRFAAIDKMKKDIDAYHQKSCVPEALYIRPGKEYANKHSICLEKLNHISLEEQKLNLAEESYTKKYNDAREKLTNASYNTFQKKLNYLWPIFKESFLSIVIGLMLVLFLGYLDVQALFQKMEMPEDDEYHSNRKRNEDLRRSSSQAAIKNQVNADAHLSFEKAKLANEVKMQELQFYQDNCLDLFQARETTLQSKIRQAKEIGNFKAAKLAEQQLEKEYKLFLLRMNQDFEPVDFSNEMDLDIFNLSTPMREVLEEIKLRSNSENLIRNIFDWVEANIKYESNHAMNHCKTAKECFNTKSGICTEMSVLMMAFLRELNITCSFVNVDIDFKGDEVLHACIQITNNGKTWLCDVAYHTFDLEHKKFNLLSDEDLVDRYKSWNA